MKTSRPLPALALLAVCALAVGSDAQTAGAVFNDFSPTIKGVTIGDTHCYLWAHVTAPWDAEVACYVAGNAVRLDVQTPSQEMVGTFALGKTGDMISWIVRPGVDAGTTYWELGWIVGGVDGIRAGVF